MQQGPSSLPSSRAFLLEGARGFAPLIAGAGAKAALLSVWPSSARRADFLGALESYRVAADSVGGILMPASYAWLLAWDIDPLLPLYDTDGLHPSPMGTYLAALVIFSAVVP